MSNLGAYQKMTTLAKKVGGPCNLGAGIFTAGVLVSGCVVGGIKLFFDKRKKSKEELKRIRKEAVVYEVHKDTVTNEGIELKKGYKFKVLNRDGDVALVEILGHNDNPFIISADLLYLVSDYRYNEFDFSYTKTPM